MSDAPVVEPAAAGQILSGIRIVDLSWGLAGPVATQLLAEAGADVVKVEPPGGDPIRSWHPSAFATWNRSKQGIVLDLTLPPDREALDALLDTADVLVHTLLPATARRHDLDDVFRGFVDEILRDPAAAFDQRHRAVGDDADSGRRHRPGDGIPHD